MRVLCLFFWGIANAYFSANACDTQYFRVIAIFVLVLFCRYLRNPLEEPGQATHCSSTNVSVMSRGEIAGTYWIDAKTGMVIKSDHSVNKVIATEQHELYQNKGLAGDQVYREIPCNTRILGALNRVHTAD